MARLTSGRVKKTPQSGLTSDRYQFLGLEQAEPDLGDPLVGPSSIEAKPAPGGARYIPIAVAGQTGQRYWADIQQFFGTSAPGAITVFDEDNQVGAANSTYILKFVGDNVSIDAVETFGQQTGIATIRFSNSPTLSSLNVSNISTLQFTGITTANIGIASVGFATITNSILGVTTVGFASVTNSILGVTTVGFASVTNSILGVTTVGFATITNGFIGVSTVGLQTVTTDLSVGGNFQVAGVSTFVGNVTFQGGTIGFGDSITDNVEFNADVNSNILPNVNLTFNLGSSTQQWKNIFVGFATITNAYVGVSTIDLANVGFASVTNSILGVTTVGFATITNGFTGVSTIVSANIGFATITNGFIGVSTIVSTNIGFATITNGFIGVSTVGLQTVTTDLSVGGNFQVAGVSTSFGGFSDGLTLQGSLTGLTSTTAAISIHSGLSTSTYRSVEYMIQATTGSRYQAIKVLSIHDGTTTYNTEYGNIYSNGSISSFNVDISDGNIRLVATASTSAVVNYIVNYTATKI